MTSEAEHEAEFTDPATVIVSGLMDTLASVSHLVVGLLSAFFFGWLGWHVSWAIFVMIGVILFDRKYKAEGWERRFRLWKRDEKKHQLIAMEKESVEWLNLALRKFYPIYSPQITDSVEAAVIQAIEAAMAVPPSPVTGVEVQGVDLGVVPPQLDMIKCSDLPGHAWQMDATLSYYSDIRIVVAVAIGGKGLSIKIPIAIKDLVIDGRLRIGLTMAPEPPLYKTMSVCFKAPPHISIGLQPLKAFDLDKFPGLGSFIRDSIVAAVGTMMVYPQKMLIELGEPRPEGQQAEELTMDADARAAAEKDPLPGKIMTLARAKKIAAQRKPEYVGRVRVIIKSAKDLQAADKSFTGKGTSDGYCKVFCGAQMQKTPTIKKNLSPTWNTSFDFLVEKAKKYQALTVQVFDEDKLGKDDCLGVATIDFSELVGDRDSETKSYTVPLLGHSALPESELTATVMFTAD